MPNINRNNRQTHRNGDNGSVPSPVSAEALMSLADDTDVGVSTLAMEQLLTRPDLPAILANYQDDSRPPRRKRIHQLQAVVSRAVLRESLLAKLSSQRCNAWDAFVALDKIYDTQSSERYIRNLLLPLKEDFQKRSQTVGALAAFMQDNNFAMPRGAFPNYTHYLLGDVLDSHDGNPALLCTVARELSSPGLKLSFCIMNGKFCLLEPKTSIILDPMENWTLNRKVAPINFHICRDSDMVITTLCQMFALSVIDWNARDMVMYAQLLGRLKAVDHTMLPYPMGNFGRPDNLSQGRKTIEHK